MAMPLFAGTPFNFPSFGNIQGKRGDHLGRLLARLNGELRRYATDAARNTTNDVLFGLHQPEHLNSRFTKLVIDLKDKTVKINVLLVSFTLDNLQLGFSPSLPELYFEIQPDESLQWRAVDVYQEYFGKRKSEDTEFDPLQYSVPGKAWLDSLVLSIPRLPIRKPQEANGLANLFGLDVSDGAEQLSTVGRCLDSLDLDDLAEPLGVGDQLHELDSILSMREPRSVVLVGPAGSGKTAVIQGWVRQRKLAEAKPRIKKLVYELSASRLISGMSYLGQWESRVTGILEFSHRMNHILYFSDFLGLYRAGVTRDSKYSVADLIRGQRDRRPVRMIAELTDEAWTILRERDPALANQFNVIRMPSLDEDRSLPVLLTVMRSLEMRYRCNFDLEAVPEIVRLYDRFVGDAVLPGKAIEAMQRLAVTLSNSVIGVESVWEEFHRRTGLAMRLIERKHPLDRETIERDLKGKLIGQSDAVRAMADRVVVTAARMNETSRPLGVLLFLGPTGVGKTEAAKCLAEYLYGETGLLRIDMNELSGPTAAATMLGTFDAPEGRLTGAVRQRPFCVVLLDEIEKAHPAVLDILLQGLGEARMTDALGRTVDLSGTVIIMTSNLGADEARRRVGFAGGEDAEKHVRLKAVRDFFRPEFVNRIDEIIHFGTLDTEDVRKIASLQLEQVLKRDGLIRRRTILDVDPAVLDWTIRQGFDVTQGARAIKRSLERFLVDIAAPQLVGLDSNVPHLVKVKLGHETPLDVTVQALCEVARETPEKQPTPQETLNKAKQFVEELDARLPRNTTSFVAGGSQKTVLEFTLREMFRSALEDIKQLAKLLEPQDLSDPVALPSVKQVKRVFGDYAQPSRLFAELGAADDIKTFLKDALIQVPVAETEIAAESVRRSLKRLEQALNYEHPFEPVRIVVRAYGSDWEKCQYDPYSESYTESVIAPIVDSLTRYLSVALDMDVKSTTDGPNVNLFIEGVLSGLLAKELRGAFLWFQADGALQLIVIGDEEHEAGVVDGNIPLRYIGHDGGPFLDLKTGVAVDKFWDNYEHTKSMLVGFWEAVNRVA